MRVSNIKNYDISRSVQVKKEETKMVSSDTKKSRKLQV